jgi:benzoate-CoA ligase family protein
MLELPETLNLTSFFLDHNLEQGRGDKTAIRFEGRSLSYAFVASQTNRVANLLGELGVQPEQRVLLLLPDVPEFAYAWFGLVKRGAVACAVSPEQTVEEARYYLSYTRARVAFCTSKLAPTIESLRSELPYLRAVVVIDGEPLRAGDVNFARAIANQSDRFEPHPTHRDDPAVWLFTSGSTGFPKAAVHRARDFAFNTLTYALPIVGYNERDVTISVPRLAFGYALGSNLLFPFRAGATVALFADKGTPERVCSLIAQEKATVLITVPTSLNAINGYADLKREAFTQMRVCVSAGEALPAEMYQRWKERTGVEVLDGIGSAEMFHIFITNRVDDVVLGSLGRVVEGYEARVCDDDGRELPRGEVGTLWVRGGSIAIEYWHNRDLSLRTFRGEWCVSQDKFTCDDKGYFRFCGRGDDLLKVGGKWVVPLELENCLLTHVAVKEAAVVGFKDVDGLEKPRAFVVVHESHTAGDALAEELKAHVKSKLEPYKYPREIRFVPELPKSERGKVLKNQLRG